MLVVNIQLFGGRGGKSGMGGARAGGALNESRSAYSNKELDEMGITGVENSKEVIVKNGVKYVETSGAGYSSGFARTDGYGMSGNGEKPTLSKIFDGKVNEAVYNEIDSKNYGTSREGAAEKYAQLRRVAEGKIYGTDYTPAHVLARANAGTEYQHYNRNGKPEGWKMEQLSSRHVVYGNGSESYGSNYHNGKMQLTRDLGSRAISTLEKTLQQQAKKWLDENPDRTGQKGWRFNGRKWVETSKRK